MSVLEIFDGLVLSRKRMPGSSASIANICTSAVPGHVQFLPILLPLILAFVATAAADEKIYWTDSESKVWRADLNGSNSEVLVDFRPGILAGIVLDPIGEKMYWSNYGIGTVERADLSGSNVEILVSGTEAWDIALDLRGGMVYWADQDQGKIQRSTLSGSNNVNLLEPSDGLISPTGIALDLIRGKMYWSDIGTEKIQRADLDGSKIEDLITNVIALDVELDLTNAKMYWTVINELEGTAGISRSNLDGTGINVVILAAEGLSYPEAIALDPGAGKLYWTDSGTVKIQQSNLNGTNIVDLITGEQGLESPLGIALELSTSIDFSMETNGDGTRTSPFNNSSELVESITPGRMILIAPGTTSETFTGHYMISKQFTLFNSNPSEGSVFIGKGVLRLPVSGGFFSRGRNAE